MKTLINPLTGKAINSLPQTFQLSEKATRELRDVLRKDIGEESLNNLTPEEVNHIGVLMLTLTATQLKIRIREVRKGKGLG